MPRKAVSGDALELARERMEAGGVEALPVDLDPKVKAQLMREASLIRLLGEIGGDQFSDEMIRHDGREIVLPEDMTKLQVVKFLIQAIERDEEMTRFSRTFDYRPLDGAYCTWNALKRAFGAIGHDSSTVQTMFGAHKAPPEVMTVQTGPHTTEQVPWGNFTVPFLPGVELVLGTGYSQKFGPVFEVTAMGPRKYQHQMQGIFNLIELELRENSMYRGKPIDGGETPGFLDLTAVDPEKVVYTQEVLAQLDANINSPLRYSAEHRELKLPLKRAILIHGPYGTGKTLAAYLTGQVAVENGWTFILARPGEDNLHQVMQTARLYQPAVVFYEDMDKVASDESSGDQITKMLDIFDGITAKGTEIMVVLTTNHKERIHKGMLRPGRLDAVIEIADLDRPGVEKLVRSIVPVGTLEPDVDFDAVHEAMSGLLPSFLKEAIDRATRYALVRNGGDPDGITLATEDLVHAATGLRPQLELMEDAKETRPPEPLGMVMDSHIRKGVATLINPDFLSSEGAALAEEVSKNGG